MTVLVVEQGIAQAVAGSGRAALAVVPRERRRRDDRWAPLAPDAVVEVLEAAGRDALVLARGLAADPAAASLPALARVMGHEVIRLPDHVDAAAWVLAVALAWKPGEGDVAHRLQVLVGAAGRARALPQRELGGRMVRIPAVRPRVLARWAGCVWRPCGRCGGGGLPGAPCGRCGIAVIGAGA